MAATDPAVADPRALRGRHRHRGALPAADRLEDVLQLLDRLRRRGAEQPRLSGVPRSPGRSAGHQPQGGRACARDRARDRCVDSRPPRVGTARTTSTPTCRRATRSRSTTCRWRRPDGSPSTRRTVRSRSTSPAPTLRRTRPSSSTRRDPTAGASSLVDFNRSGAPLMEIVTEPDLRTAEQARRYAEELRLLLRSIGASDADMERRPAPGRGERVVAPTRHRSLRHEGRGQEHELVPRRGARHRLRDRATGAALDAGESLVQETRGWADDRGETYRMRVKESSDDYRYFPEPDLPPLHVDPAWLDELGGRLPELPAARRTRYTMPSACRRTTRPFSSPIRRTALFEATWRATGSSTPRSSPIGSPGSTCVSVTPRARSSRRAPVDPAQLAAIVGRSMTGALGTNAKEVFDAHSTSEAVGHDHRRRGYRQITDAGAVEMVVDEVIAANPVPSPTIARQGRSSGSSSAKS